MFKAQRLPIQYCGTVPRLNHFAITGAALWEALSLKYIDSNRGSAGTRRLLPSIAKTQSHAAFSKPLMIYIASQPGTWWNRPAKDINADIADWQDNEPWLRQIALPFDPSDQSLFDHPVVRVPPPDALHEDVPAQLTQFLDQLPSQKPAPYLFDWRDGRMDVLPPDALPEDGGIAQDYLDETRDKAQGLLDRLTRSNVDPDIAHKTGKLLAVLTERATDLRPALVDSRTISLERLAKALDNPQDEREMSSTLLSDVGDLADTARRLCHCLPDLSRREVERLANGLSSDTAPMVLKHLDAVRQGAEESGIVGPNAQAALDTLSTDAAEPVADDLHHRRIAMFAVTIRNLLHSLPRVPGASKAAVTEALIRVAQDFRKEYRSALIKTVAVPAAAATVAAVAYLIVSHTGPIGGIARYLEGFREIEQVVKLVEKLKGDGF